ncbi:flagellar biosynthetic protein FliO [Halanaerobacter jeridensis]|uniref:Flagellar protein FliO/FliZ n=1 Tax=Halanaerobacter jeridensis TaxID=706427 RepID=A0A939BNE7_9FIRM|nr:flagellar biosynthetic protein FliO [Halanaerobacter jeridensis]MBM7555352.1 flagellar protein FliO/FliZ [Halanaerobacter jeridensis]
MEYTWDLLKVLLVLVGILSLFYAIAKFIRNKKVFNETNQIKVLERSYLNSDQVLYLVQVVEEIWLVTATEQKIEFVKQVELDVEDFEESTAQGPNILNYFKKGTDSKDEE